MSDLFLNLSFIQDQWLEFAFTGYLQKINNTQGHRGGGAPLPAFHTLVEDISLYRGATHFTPGLRPCIISSFLLQINLRPPPSKLPSCTPGGELLYLTLRIMAVWDLLNTCFIDCYSLGYLQSTSLNQAYYLHVSVYSLWICIWKILCIYICIGVKKTFYILVEIRLLFIKLLNTSDHFFMA